MVILVLAAMAPDCSPAQNPSGVFPDSSLSHLISRLGSDTQRSMRLSTHQAGRLEADSLFLLGDSVILYTVMGERAIAVTNVDSVWVQRGTAAPIIGIIAAVPCAVFGAMVGGFLGGDPDSNGSETKSVLYSIIGFAGGAIACGSLGAGVGSFFRRWQLEYPVSAEPNPEHLSLSRAR